MHTAKLYIVTIITVLLILKTSQNGSAKICRIFLRLTIKRSQ